MIAFQNILRPLFFLWIIICSALPAEAQEITAGTVLSDSHGLPGIYHLLQSAEENNYFTAHARNALTVAPAAFYLRDGKELAIRRERGKNMFKITMSLSAGFTAVALVSGLLVNKHREWEDNLILSLSSVGSGFLAGGNFILGMGIGLPLWKAKYGRHQLEP